MSTLLGMFAKYWQPGQVKTRLARTVGFEKAALIHQAFVETLLARFDSMADSRIVLFAPPTAQPHFREMVSRPWRLAPQTAGDLGCRMRNFFEGALTEFDRIVLIGSDSPDLPVEFVADALEALRTFDVALGPTTDGGYYLVGAARRVPPIFEGLDWSTPAVWSQTTGHLQAAQIAWHELPGWYDVDDEVGLRAVLANVNMEGFIDPHLRILEGRLLDLVGGRK